MTSNTILITGTPRSGTTMTCHLLNKLPDTVALHEPTKGAQLRSQQGMVAAVEQFCGDQRRSILERKLARSKHVGGSVPDDPVGSSLTGDGHRQRLVSKGEIVIDKVLSPDIALVVKHCGAFTAALENLTAQFPVFAVVRNPLATIASWSSVEFAVRQGRMRNAEFLDPGLRERLDACSDDLDRQIALLEWFHDLFVGASQRNPSYTMRRL